MLEFTFAATTYNQQEYILEHLESIKYQIINFGQHIRFNLVISDDNSTDNTIEYCESWIKKHKLLFEKTTINKNRKNLGIVANYIKCTELIETKYFKMLDGDDLYYYNNIFDLINLSDFIITYPINLRKNKFNFSFNKSFFSKSKDEIKRRLIESTDICGGGVFTNIKLLNIPQLREIIAPYKMLADYPMWVFLFLYSDINFQFKTSSKIYVIVRQLSGITSKPSEEAGSVFLDELEDFAISNNLLQYSKSKKYKYYKYLLIKKYIFRSSFYYQKLKNKFRLYEKYLAKRYYQSIISNVDLFRDNSKLL